MNNFDKLNSFDSFDKLEQRIHDTLTEIEVDPQGFKERFSMNNMDKKQKKPYRRFAMAAAALLVFVAISATAYAAGGGLEQFLSRFNPAFGDLAVQPLEAVYAEDQGIRFEVIGAQQIGSFILMYMTMQDMTGENRLNRDTWPDFEVFTDGNPVGGAGSTRRLHFDSNENRIYFEKLITGELGIPRAEVLEIGATSVLYTGFGLDVSRPHQPTATITEEIQTAEPTPQAGQMMHHIRGEWRISLNLGEDMHTVLTWTDLQVGDFYIDYMSLTPLGLRFAGHGYNFLPYVDRPTVEIELENRRRNLRFRGRSGGLGYDSFEFTFFAERAPIDVDAVTAVIIDGVRITPLP